MTIQATSEGNTLKLDSPVPGTSLSFWAYAQYGDYASMDGIELLCSCPGELDEDGNQTSSYLLKLIAETPESWKGSPVLHVQYYLLPDGDRTELFYGGHHKA